MFSDLLTTAKERLRSLLTAVAVEVADGLEKLDRAHNWSGFHQAVPQAPNHVKDVLEQIDNNGTPPEGYKGGKHYRNEPVGTGQKLPEGAEYKEYDIYPKVAGQNRGAERLVLGSDGSVWYTSDHYKTFIQIR